MGGTQSKQEPLNCEDNNCNEQQSLPGFKPGPQNMTGEDKKLNDPSESPGSGKQDWTSFEIMRTNLEEEYGIDNIREVIADNGITMYGAFLSNHDITSEPISSEERHHLLKDERLGLLGGCKIATDVYCIQEIPETIYDKTKMIIKWSQPERIPNAKYYDFKAVVFYHNEGVSDWRIIDDCDYENLAFIFATDLRVERICIIARSKKEKFTISSEGCTFQSKIEEGIKISFPEGAVCKDEHIEVELVPIIDEGKYDTEDNTEEESTRGKDTGAVTTLSPCVYIPHIDFLKDVQIELPMTTIDSTTLAPQDMQVLVFKLTEERKLIETETEAVINDGKAFFKVRSFCGFNSTTSPRWEARESVTTETERLLGLKNFCKILLFVKRTDEKHMNIMMECVEVERVNHVAQARQNDKGYEYIKEWASKDIPARPVKTIFKVDVRGKFKIPTDAKVKHPEILFCPSARENFTLFGVELDLLIGKSCGIITVRSRKQALYDIIYDPDSRKKVVTQVDNLSSFFSGNFVDDKGLTRLAGLLENVFEIVINMDMTATQYLDICKTYPNSVVQKMILLKTALKKQKSCMRVTKLISALEETGEKLLADEIRDLNKKGKKLSDLKPN